MTSHFSIIRKSLFILIVIVALINMSGCKKDESSKTCNITQYGGTDSYGVQFAYSGGWLASVTNTFSGTPFQRLDIIYDSKKQVDSAIYFNIASNGDETEGYRVKFENGSNGKPLTVATFFSNNPNPVKSTSFTYDSKGRLSTRTDADFNGLKTRFEYDDNDNVTKIYYTQNGGSEVLGRENTSFDTHARFYASSPGLDILETYLFGLDHSKNNVLHSTVTMTVDYNHGSITGSMSPPTEVSFSVAYNTDGMIKVTTGGYNIVPDVNFLFATYNCH